MALSGSLTEIESSVAAWFSVDCHRVRRACVGTDLLELCAVYCLRWLHMSRWERRQSSWWDTKQRRCAAGAVGIYTLPTAGNDFPAQGFMGTEGLMLTSDKQHWTGGLIELLHGLNICRVLQGQKTYRSSEHASKNTLLPSSSKS